jgi:Cft2 family RNA processing exonuclease
MKIIPISGYGIKGPACFLVETDGRRLLLDLGEGPEPGLKPDVARIGKVDAVLISHSHKDHIGSLDLLAEIGNPSVYATEIVKALHLETPLASALTLPLRGQTEILGISVTTGRASHAPGGVWMRIGGEDGVLYSGDWTAESVLFPLDVMPQARHFICDAAYGVYDASVSDCRAQLITAAEQNAKILLPMPPEGRGLETAIAFSEHGIEVALCPAHRRVAEKLIDDFPDTLDETGRERLGRLLAAAGYAEDANCQSRVLIAAGATAESGLAKTLVERHLPNQDVGIIFTGHVPRRGIAAQLVASKRADQFRWNVHPRLRDVNAMLSIVRPEHFIPAFLPLEKIADLLAHLGLPQNVSGHASLLNSAIR